VADDPTISRRGSTGILASSAVAAASAIAVTIISARVLSVADNAEFITFWSLLFGLFQVVGGVQNEATRAISSLGTDAAGRPAGSRAPVVAMPLALGGGLAVLTGVAAASVGDRLGAGLSAGVVLVSLLVIVGYACHLTIIGTLAGRHHWGWLAGLNAAEALVRVTAVAIAGLTARALGSLQLAAALPAVTWLALVLWALPVRRALTARTSLDLATLLRNGLLTVVSSASAAVLINGFPAIVRIVLTPRVAGSDLVPLLLAIQVTRAPLMMPLVAFQGVAIAAFVARRHDHLAALARPLLLIASLGVLVAVAMGLVGPWGIRLLYGQGYRVAPLVCVALTAAAISLAVLTVSGAAALAISQHRAFATGWVVAAIVTIGLLWLPVTPLLRPAIAVGIGPLLGAAILWWAIHRHDARVRSEPVRG